jgi:hypothetical protein
MRRRSEENERILLPRKFVEERLHMPRLTIDQFGKDHKITWPDPNCGESHPPDFETSCLMLA